MLVMLEAYGGQIVEAWGSKEEGYGEDGRDVLEEKREREKAGGDGV